jgi:hypothetical protein
MFRFFGIALIVLGLGIGVLPQFTDCYSQGLTSTLANDTVQPMKCHWTAEAEIAIAIPLIGVGAVLTANRRKRTVMSVSILGVLLGAMAIALPSALIGTCVIPTHICNTAMKPALNALGSLAMIGSLGAMVVARKARE